MIEPFQDVIREGLEPQEGHTPRASLLAALLRASFKRLAPLMARLPAADLRSLLLAVLNRAVRRLPPEQAARFLLRLDNDLYALQSAAAIAMGEGLHTKHRHLRYAEFFSARIPPGQRVLDVGCGLGAVAYHLAQAGAQVVGMDIVPEKIEEARQRHSHPNAEYRVGDALALRDEAFDVVVLSNVLEHLPRRGEFLNRLLAAARPKKVLIRVPVFERDWRVPLKKELGLEWRLDPTHETEFTLDSFQAETEAAGLVIEHLEVRWGEIWAELTPRAA
ncbi:MAG: class I SAM-dependent methyltransferase [Chloroflexi bacterium]|nr:class I SAM-dependent methyltransferase [Chloroflexota bacterium]